MNSGSWKPQQLPYSTASKELEAARAKAYSKGNHPSQTAMTREEEYESHERSWAWETGPRYRAQLMKRIKRKQKLARRFEKHRMEKLDGL